MQPLKNELDVQHPTWENTYYVFMVKEEKQDAR